MRSDRGSIVAEFAIALPAVMLVLAMLLAGVHLAGLQLRAQDAAADAARSWARGEGSGIVQSRLARQVPGATVGRHRSGDLICATVTVRARGAGGLLGIRVSAGACALSGGR